MTSSGGTRIHPLLEAGALVAVFLLLAMLAGRQVASLDVGFHLRAGEHLLAGEGWPGKDEFTYTLSNRDYIDTSWGYQVILALAHRVGGAPALVLLHAAVILAVFWMLVLTARAGPADPLALPGLLLLGALASELRFEVRPELFSHLMLALTLLVLHRHAGRRTGAGGPRLLLLLPLIQLVWANTHGLFVLGWVAMGCFMAGLWIRDRRLDLALAGWSAGAVAVTVINPYGVRGMLFPFTLASRLQQDNIFAGSIGEFVSPLSLNLSAQFPFYPRIPIVSFWILVVLSLVAVVVTLARKRWWCALLWLPFLALSLQMIRNIPLMVIACLPWMAWSFDTGAILRRGAALAGRALSPAALRKALAAVAVLVIIVSFGLILRVASDAYYLDSRRMTRTGLGWNRLTLPVDASDYARKAGFHQERVLNHLNFGGWLMWALDSKVFIDGRLEVVGEEFYRRYRRILEDEHAMEEAVERHGIRWLIFPYITNPKLLIAMSDDPRWRIAYLDHLAVIFVRFRPEAEPWVDPALMQLHRIHEETPDYAELPGLGERPAPGRLSLWLRGFYRRQTFPSLDHGIGLFHYYRGEIGLAAARFARAVALSDGAWYETYNNLGSALYHIRRHELAEKAFQVVLSRDPDNPIATARMEELRSLPDLSR